MDTQLETVCRWIASNFDVRLGDLDVERLGEGARADLVALVEKARAGDGRGRNLEQLTPKEQKRLERLLERLAGLPARHFERGRDVEKLHQRVAALARRAAKPIRPGLGREAGLFELLGRDLSEGTLWAEHVLVLTVVLAQLLRAEPLAPQARIEGEGLDVTLVADRRYGVLGVDHDPEAELLARWIEPLEHLAVNQLLDVDRDGAEYRIKMGGRVRAALWEGKS
jgi:hypothetical protein